MKAIAAVIAASATSAMNSAGASALVPNGRGESTLPVTTTAVPLAAEESDDDCRFLEVCMDGDVEDLVGLLEELARGGEALTAAMLNMPDQSGRVRQHYR